MNEYKNKSFMKILPIKDQSDIVYKHFTKRMKVMDISAEMEISEYNIKKCLQHYKALSDGERAEILYAANKEVLFVPMVTELSDIWHEKNNKVFDILTVSDVYVSAMRDRNVLRHNKTDELIRINEL